MGGDPDAAVGREPRAGGDGTAAQRLRKEFKQISFKPGETLDAFGMRITGIANNLRSLGDTVEEIKVVQKFLREVPKQYAQIACSI